MSLSTIITGAVIDIGKKFLFKTGKRVAHDFVDSVAVKHLGKDPQFLLFLFSHSKMRNKGI